MAWRKPADIRGWLRILGRHKYKFFFTAVGVMIAVVIASKWVPPQYTVDAKFSRSVDSSAQSMGANAVNRGMESFRRTYAQDLKGRPTIEQLLEDLDMTRNLPHGPDGELTLQGQIMLQDLVTQTQSRVGVSFDIQSDLVDHITVRYTDTDRALAPKIINRLVDNYLRSTRQKLDEALISAKNFFDREVSRYQGKVTELENKSMRFQRENAGMRPDDPVGLQNQIAEVRTRLGSVSQELTVKTEMLSKMQEFIEAQPMEVEETNIGTSPEYLRLSNAKTLIEQDLENQLTVLGRTYEHPMVIKLRKRTAELDALIAATPEMANVGKTKKPNAERTRAVQEAQVMSGMLVALERSRDELTSELEKLQIRDRNFLVIRNDYTKMNEELEEARNQLGFWQDNLRRTSIALQTEVNNSGQRLSVINYATELARPTSPTVSKILSAAMMLGLGCGAVVVLLCELMDHSFHTIEQAVDELKLPVLGAVNEIVTPAAAMRRRVMSIGVYPAVSAALAVVLMVAVWVTYVRLVDPHSYDRMFKNPSRFLKETLTGG